MVCIKRISIAVAVIALGVSMVPPSEVFALNQEQKDAIVQNCSNIQQSLTKLQHSDSRTRTYLGSAYEAISGRFIVPLNLRLVKNNLPSVELAKAQNDFSVAQTRFRDSYVGYMRELESLIATNCAAQPEEFYGKLTQVREKRETLRKITKDLAELADKQYQSVTELRASL